MEKLQISQLEKKRAFFEVIIDNNKINAHSLILVDINMKAREALEFLEKTAGKKKFKLEKIVICSRLGCKDEKIYYARISELMAKKIEAPFCFIISGKLHFLEEESLGKIEK